MSNTIYLYLKTHNKTGLKYLGKTTQNPFEYHGSGVYWKSHLKKHGYDITTEILFETEDKNKFKQKAIYYSKLWNVETNKDFANLSEEQGQGGNIGNQGYSKASATKNSLDWKSSKGISWKENMIKTKTSKEWKETVGAIQKEKERLTKSNPEWLNNVGKRVRKQYSENAKKVLGGKDNPNNANNIKCCCLICKNTYGVANIKRHYESHE